MNDHVFLCPRQLCRPYFTLLELWNSSLCNASSSPAAQRRIFARSSRAPSGQFAPLSSPYVLPPAPQLSAQWYMFARYVPWPANPCGSRQSDFQCCGLIRGMVWPYGLRRKSGNLECLYRVRRRIPPSQKHGLNFSKYMTACFALERADYYQQPYCRTGTYGPNSSNCLASLEHY